MGVGKKVSRILPCDTLKMKKYLINYYCLTYCYNFIVFLWVFSLIIHQLYLLYCFINGHIGERRRKVSVTDNRNNKSAFELRFVKTGECCSRIVGLELCRGIFTKKQKSLLIYSLNYIALFLNLFLALYIFRKNIALA